MLLNIYCVQDRALRRTTETVDLAAGSVVMLLALERKNRFSNWHRSFCQRTVRCEKHWRAIGCTSAAVLVVEISALDYNCPFSADISATRTAALMLPIARTQFSRRTVQWQKLRCWLLKRFFRSSASSITTGLPTNADCSKNEDAM